MRIRKEIEKWNIVLFLKLSVILLVIFNFFYLFSAYLDNALTDINITNWIILSVFYPVFFASLLTNGFRKGTLFINDYSTISEFTSKIKSKILSENFELELETETKSVYKPIHWYYKLFNGWKGSEKLVVTWGNEIVVYGSLRKISNLEDIVTWNADFKTTI
jgi:hypothetical protein